MIVYQVYLEIDTLNYIDRSEDSTREIDCGIFETLNGADSYIKEDMEKEIAYTKEQGTSAWLSVVEKEEPDGVEDYAFRNGMMVHDQRTGEYLTFTYTVRVRELGS